ncbi:MAG: hypothetical protein HQ512_11910 [Rhodospirillales bacterium]|nr:hypothetical protein [Rhodospirillales bacterium]
MKRFSSPKKRPRKRPAAKSTAAKSAEEKAWADFVSWCKARNLTAVPTNPWTLATYARWCEPHQRYPALAKTIKAIAKIHTSKSRKRPERHPMVTRTLRLIETRARTKKKTKDAPAALFPEDDIIGTGKPEAPKKNTIKKKPSPTTKKKTLKGLSAGPKLISKRKLKD